ncbi:hypothetical protein TIFTF001_025451 [Ficus carica]|uniref:TF-B3 domain-containing protein n=1 Tax=Ficus carica TaxID=3494 RepID=A0AA88AMX7_FICCA|nr:hypothetical protein TIFTF001_025451 [Ficus carica]
MKYYEKILSETDVTSKLMVPTAWVRPEDDGDLLLPGDMMPGEQREIQVVDEVGNKYKFRLKVRSDQSHHHHHQLDPDKLGGNYNMKPEFMAKEWKAFVLEKALKAGDRIYVWKDKDSDRIVIKVKVPPLRFPLFGIIILV